MNKGPWFESRAAEFLRAAGLQVLETNFRCRLGEIDLICRDEAALVFVEVRYRSRSQFASAASSIDRTKQRRLLRAAQYYLQQRGLSDRQPCRIDVIAIDGGPGRAQDGIQWIRDAITS
jgi:putative endonuclease